MYEHQTVYQAARSLASDLALSPSRATVFAWSDNLGERIVVAVNKGQFVDLSKIPTEFHGYPVELQDEISGVAGARLH